MEGGERNNNNRKDSRFLVDYSHTVWRNCFITVVYFQVDVLQETVRYIEDLERRLLAQVHCAGLPRQLLNCETKSNPERPESKPEVQIHDLRNMLHTSLQPVLEAKLKKQRLEDEAKIAQLLRDAGSSRPQT